MTHKFEKEFFLIVDQIIQENKSLEEWNEIEADDMFQEGNYVGGFEGTEMEFAFRYYSRDDEYWFQLSLDEIMKVKEGELKEVEMRPADLKPVQSSTEYKMKKLHYEEILLILFICATDLSEYEETSLVNFTECIEGSVEVLFERDYLRGLNDFLNVDEDILRDFEQLQSVLVGLYAGQWHNKMRGEGAEWKNANRLAKKILASIKVDYVEPEAFMDDENNLRVDWVGKNVSNNPDFSNWLSMQESHDLGTSAANRSQGSAAGNKEKFNFGYLNIGFIVWLLAVLILNLTGHLAFGHGLGDIYYLVWLFIISVVLLAIYFSLLRKGSSTSRSLYVYYAIIIAVVILFTLKLSIWRGPEFRWDGRLFLR